MKLMVSPSIAAKYPALRIAALVATGLDNAGSSAEIAARMRSAEQAVRDRFASAEALGQAAPIAVWRELYRSFGTNPSRSRPSAEALLRRVVRGDALPSINLAVDCYLLCELGHLLPVGGYDLDRVSGAIELRHARAGEPFRGIGGAQETTDLGEVVYADAAQVLTRRWNYRDSDSAKITEHARRIALFVEAPVPAITTAAIQALIAAIAAELGAVCRARVTTGLLDLAVAHQLELEG